MHQLVGPCLRGAAVTNCGAKNFLAVLIGAGEQERTLAALTMPASQHVGSHLGVGVTDVRSIVHIEDWGRYVKRLTGLAGHCSSLRSFGWVGLFLGVEAQLIEHRFAHAVQFGDFGNRIFHAKTRGLELKHIGNQSRNILG